MNDRVRQLREQIAALQMELLEAVREPHKRLKTGFFSWRTTNRPQNLVTGPIIYGMIVPLVLLDLFVSIYQATCFPIYKLAKMRRGDYLVFDRHKLERTRQSVADQKHPES